LSNHTLNHYNTHKRRSELMALTAGIQRRWLAECHSFLIILQTATGQPAAVPEITLFQPDQAYR
uniref:hypothetical protein n=1 Tax=Ruegeria arenilitoris TaxID=1173585 RepID=UPI001C2CA697